MSRGPNCGTSKLSTAALFPARVYYLCDTAIGAATGSACPNCGHKRNPAIVRRHAQFIAVRKCLGCELLYRPVGFVRGILPDLYYSFLYTSAGLATTRGFASDPEELERRMCEEGKDRTALIQGLVSPPAKLCVLGCSWGYEMLPLIRRGYTVFGVELSRTRRAFGRRRLGLQIYATLEDAAEDHPHTDVLLSSHVLEHVPRVTSLVETATRALHPNLQVHVTPNVEGFGERNSALIGREHPIGVTGAYWKRLATALHLAVEFRGAGDEATAVLRPLASRAAVTEG